jgi:hypothetical protein
VILDHVQEFSSERLLRRFLRKLPAFPKHKEIADRRRFKESMINIIGEFMLISLGIISPEMFKLNKFSINQDEIDNLTLSTESTQDEVLNLFRYYNLRGINGQPIFYNRRYTQNQLPSRESDELVKDFLQKLRGHQGEVFQAF